MLTDYNELMKIFNEIYMLNSMGGILYWDMNTYMPPKALSHRTAQFNWLQTKVHSLWTNKKIEELILKCKGDPNLDNIQSRNVELMLREIDNRTCLPKELVGELARQSNKTLEISPLYEHRPQGL